MEKITRRSLLSAGPAIGLAAIVPAADATVPVLSPQEEAVWHMSQLKRIVMEATGAIDCDVLGVGIFAKPDGDKRFKTFGLHTSTGFTDPRGVFTSKGGAA